MMEGVVILTPIAPGTVVPPADLGIPRVFSECAPFDLSREANINVNRARLQSLYRTKLHRKYPYVILMDSDVVVTKDDLVKLVEAWKPNTTPCIRTKRVDGDHVCCACCFMLGEDYIKVNYLEHPRQCQCLKVQNPYYVDGLQGSEV